MTGCRGIGVLESTAARVSAAELHPRVGWDRRSSGLTRRVSPYRHRAPRGVTGNRQKTVDITSGPASAPVPTYRVREPEAPLRSMAGRLQRPAQGLTHIQLQFEIAPGRRLCGLKNSDLTYAAR